MADKPSVDLIGLMRSFKGRKAMVIGDLMLDQYIEGASERTSPEADVPVIDVQSRYSKAGGAANVALNLKALGYQVSLFGHLGRDEGGEELSELLSAAQIDLGGTVFTKEIATTLKLRIFLSGEQYVRCDTDGFIPSYNELHEGIFGSIKKQIKANRPDLVILQDYDKGLLNSHLIKDIVTLCAEEAIIVTADPKFDHYYDYNGVNLFKPNWKEAIHAEPQLEKAGGEEALKHQLLEHRRNHGCKNLLVTVGARGMLALNANEELIEVKGQKRSVKDVSGAGDTVLALASAVFELTGDLEAAAKIANLAAGLVCEERGVVTVPIDRLLAELTMLS